jgi:hypothetical protein
VVQAGPTREDLRPTAWTGEQCHEYPITARHNTDQGNRIGLFNGSTAIGCKLPEQKEYAVIPIPVEDIPTTWLCGN